MVFSSITFLFIFLPAVLILYFTPVFFMNGELEIKKKNLILCISSLVFYAWGEPIYIVLMLLSIWFNFCMGLDMEKNAGKTSKLKTLMVFDILFNLGILGFFKYSDFIINNLNSLFSLSIHPLRLSLPVGISFYTFQILSYVIDVYRGQVKAQKNVISFAMYISMFPQLIAGPIVQYSDIERQLNARQHSISKFHSGMTVFIRGLGKKVLFANTIGAVYTQVCALGIGSISAATAWIGIACYTLQIYFDFSGYSDMAIGLGRMFGFEFMQNFNFPYIATSIKDFWSRWHISLSSWFRDYVYIPLGGNRKGTLRTIFNIAVVWCLTGLWHGAAWNFIAWGAFYGILLIAEKYILGSVLPKIPSVVKHLTTMLIVMIGWVFFSSESFGDALIYIRSLFMLNSNAPFDTNSLYFISAFGFPFVIMCLSAFGLFEKMPKLKPSALKTTFESCGYFLILALCIVCLISDTYNPFLYFRF